LENGATSSHRCRSNPISSPPSPRLSLRRLLSLATVRLSACSAGRLPRLGPTPRVVKRSCQRGTPGQYHDAASRRGLITLPPPLLWRSAALQASSHDAGARTRSSSMGEQRRDSAGVVGHEPPSSAWRVGACSPLASRTRRSACSSTVMHIGCSQPLLRDASLTCSSFE
jgi:hypothetical protein